MGCVTGVDSPWSLIRSSRAAEGRWRTPLLWTPCLETFDERCREERQGLATHDLGHHFSAAVSPNPNTHVMLAGLSGAPKA